VIIVTSKHHSKIEGWIAKNYKGKIKPDMVTVSEDLESAEVLVKIKHMIYVQHHVIIQGDFILISCDTITDFNLYDLLDFHYQHNSTISVLMKKEDLEQGRRLGKAPLSCNLTENYDICLLNPDTAALAFITNSDELEDGEFNVKRSILLR
jgi:NDP-sugar pyrophosphorylase family protein